jgi:hypothetical protein
MNHTNNLLLVCIIISLVPAGYAKLTSGTSDYYSTVARSSSEKPLSSCLDHISTAWNWGSHDLLFNHHLFSSVNYSAKDTWNYTTDFPCLPIALPNHQFSTMFFLCDLRLLPWLSWILWSHGLLRSIRWFETDVSELPISPIFKSQAVQKEDGPISSPKMSASKPHTPNNNSKDGRIHVIPSSCVSCLLTWSHPDSSLLLGHFLFSFQFKHFLWNPTFVHSLNVPMSFYFVIY